ncbi:MAG: hypothetical protein ACRDCE_15525 [Cetobacterium sp.]|uniref:hypothetical protein n=1 Tax=Cetobacterium sp. TaxID=2071632 RepID=UPI003EE5E9E9
MTNQTAIFTAIRAAITGLVSADVMAALPETAIPVDGGRVWSAVIPVSDWCDNEKYSAHMFNRDGAKAAAKKDHLKGETTTDIQRTVIACLDSDGKMTKLDGHCRAEAWKSGELLPPACGTVICFIHILPEGETSKGVYVQELLKHAINKAGKLTATEEKAAAQKWAGAANNFEPKSWFVISSLSKAAIDASKAATDILGNTLKMFVEKPILGKELLNNLIILHAVREMAEGFKWEKPVASTVKFDQDGQEVALSKEERAADRKGKEWTKGASVAAILIASHNVDPEAALHFWYGYGTAKQSKQARAIWEAAYNLGAETGQVNADTKAAFVKQGCELFAEWYQGEWKNNSDVIKAAYKEAQAMAASTPDVMGEGEPKKEAAPVEAVITQDGESVSLSDLTDRPEEAATVADVLGHVSDYVAQGFGKWEGITTLMAIFELTEGEAENLYMAALKEMAEADGAEENIVNAYMAALDDKR